MGGGAFLEIMYIVSEWVVYIEGPLLKMEVVLVVNHTSTKP
jgi:hypothetical protein